MVEPKFAYQKLYNKIRSIKMAIITKITKSNNYTMKNSLAFCEAEYNDYIYDNIKYVRIQTFGSNQRQKKGKQS